jgi:hypothetical protein
MLLASPSQDSAAWQEAEWHPRLRLPVFPTLPQWKIIARTHTHTPFGGYCPQMEHENRTELTL